MTDRAAFEAAISAPPSNRTKEAMTTEPKAVAWRYQPSEVWGDYVLTEKPEEAQLAREYGCEVSLLYPQSAIDALSAKVREMESDAARYRWLRGQHWNASNLFVVSGPSSRVRLGTDCPSHGRLDAAIDAALASLEQPKDER